MDVAQFKQQPIMGILRGIGLDLIEPLVETVVSSGLKTVEITMNTKGAAELINKAVKLSNKRLCVGAGTVLNMDSLKLALSSGATFAVLPCLIEDVVDYCVKNKIAVFPGAFTPQEIYKAWNRGATMVKVFPVKFLGPEYFLDIKGPFEEIEFLACSGVRPDNLEAYFANGANAVSFGSSVFKKEWLAVRDFKNIASRITEYLQALDKCKL